MISGLNYDKGKGIRLAIGNGEWYLFYDRSKDFRKKHHFHEIHVINGILYWRNIGRVVFIRDVPIRCRMMWNSPKRKIVKDDEGQTKKIIIMHT